MRSDAEIGILVIHRDLPGDHDTRCPEFCWCDPHVIYEDDSRTPQQIVEEVSVKEFRQ